MKFSGLETPGRGITIADIRGQTFQDETDGITDDVGLIMLLVKLGAGTRSYARGTKKARRCLAS